MSSWNRAYYRFRATISDNPTDLAKPVQEVCLAILRETEKTLASYQCGRCDCGCEIVSGVVCEGFYRSFHTPTALRCLEQLDSDASSLCKEPSNNQRHKELARGKVTTALHFERDGGKQECATLTIGGKHPSCMVGQSPQLIQGTPIASPHSECDFEFRLYRNCEKALEDPTFLNTVVAFTREAIRHPKRMDAFKYFPPHVRRLKKMESIVAQEIVVPALSANSVHVLLERVEVTDVAQGQLAEPTRYRRVRVVCPNYAVITDDLLSKLFRYLISKTTRPESDSKWICQRATQRSDENSIVSCRCVELVLPSRPSEICVERKKLRVPIDDLNYIAVLTPREAGGTHALALTEPRMEAALALATACTLSCSGLSRDEGVEQRLAVRLVLCVCGYTSDDAAASTPFRRWFQADVFTSRVLSTKDAKGNCFFTLKDTKTSCHLRVSKYEERRIVEEGSDKVFRVCKEQGAVARVLRPGCVFGFQLQVSPLFGMASGAAEYQLTAAEVLKAFKRQDDSLEPSPLRTAFKKGGESLRVTVTVAERYSIAGETDVELVVEREFVPHYDANGGVATFRPSRCECYFAPCGPSLTHPAVFRNVACVSMLAEWVCHAWKCLSLLSPPSLNALQELDAVLEQSKNVDDAKRFLSATYRVEPSDEAELREALTAADALRREKISGGDLKSDRVGGDVQSWMKAITNLGIRSTDELVANFKNPPGLRFAAPIIPETVAHSLYAGFGHLSLPMSVEHVFTRTAVDCAMRLQQQRFVAVHLDWTPVGLTPNGEKKGQWELLTKAIATDPASPFYESQKKPAEYHCGLALVTLYDYEEVLHGLLAEWGIQSFLTNDDHIALLPVPMYLPGLGCRLSSVSFDASRLFSSSGKNTSLKSCGHGYPLFFNSRLVAAANAYTQQPLSILHSLITKTMRTVTVSAKSILRK